MGCYTAKPNQLWCFKPVLSDVLFKVFTITWELLLEKLNSDCNFQTFLVLPCISSCLSLYLCVGRGKGRELIVIPFLWDPMQRITILSVSLNVMKACKLQLDAYKIVKVLGPNNYCMWSVIFLNVCIWANSESDIKGRLDKRFTTGDFATWVIVK